MTKIVFLCIIKTSWPPPGHKGKAMSEEKKTTGNNIRDIRTYILGLIYRNSFTSVRVPSSMELAKQFSVTRRTARMVLEGLIAEGFLIGRNGVGTFTNPHCGFRMPGVEQRLLVGVGVVCCNNFYYDLQSGLMFTEIMSALCRNGVNVFPLTNMPSERAQFSSELAVTGLDGLIIGNPELPDGMLTESLASGTPCVTVKTKIDGADFVEIDYRAAFRELFAEMKRNGEKDLIILEQEALPYTGGIEKDIPEEVNCRIMNVDSVDYYRILNEVFSGKYGACDHLVCSWRAPKVISRLREMYGVAPEKLQVTLESDYVEDTGFSGSYFDINRKAAAEAAVELLLRRIADPSLPPQTKIVEAVFTQPDNKIER